MKRAGLETASTPKENAPDMQRCVKNVGIRFIASAAIHCVVLPYAIGTTAISIAPGWFLAARFASRETTGDDFRPLKTRNELRWTR